MTVDDQAQATMFELTVEQSTTATSVSGIKKKRAQKVRQHNLSEADLTTPKPRSTRKRKDKSVRALYREKLASLNIEALKAPESRPECWPSNLHPAYAPAPRRGRASSAPCRTRFGRARSDNPQRARA